MFQRKPRNFQEDYKNVPLSQSCAFSWKPHYSQNIRFNISKKKMNELFVKWVTESKTQELIDTLIKEQKTGKQNMKNSPGQRPEACLILCLSCFKSISLIIVRSQGPRWAKLGVADNPRIPVWEENRSKIVWWRSWGAPRGVFGRFSCRPSCAHVSGSLRGPFWEPFWPQKCSFGDLVFWSRGSFF